jgi:putative hemolysin
VRTRLLLGIGASIALFCFAPGCRSDETPPPRSSDTPPPPASVAPPAQDPAASATPPAQDPPAASATPPAQASATPAPSTGDPDGEAVGRAVQQAIDAGESTTRTLVTEKGAKKPLLRVEKLRFTISASCLGADKKLACDAFKGIKAIVGKTIPHGPGTPAAYACKVVGATNATWSDAEGNQYGMCVFPDGSVVDDWAFLYTPHIVLKK